ncbi:hypothetical protein Tco_0538438 [Tanacetum coccineum]
MSDDQPMWGNDRAVAPTPGVAIIPVDLGNNFTVNGHHLSMIKDRQFDGRARADPHKHITKFITICDRVLLKLDWSKDIKIKPLKKTVALTKGSDNSKLMKKMEALTTKIDLQFRDIKGEMKELQDGCNNYGGVHPSSECDDKPMGGSK